jgi:DNA mismatch repair protein MutS
VAHPETSLEPQMVESLTPFMRQWTAAKNEHPDTLLFFRMGDFYELFYDDAITAARELQITLTARDRERAIPMCGVPYHAAEGYLQRLLRKGFRIAICEQMEDPKLTKKIVRREVTRVLTPGTAFDNNLDQSQNNFLAAFHEDGTTSAMALLDLSTGDFRTAEFTGPSAHNQALDELLKAQPSELLLPANAPAETSPPRSTEPATAVAARTRIDDWVWTRDYAVPLVERKLGVAPSKASAFSRPSSRRHRRGSHPPLRPNHPETRRIHLDSLRFTERSTELQLDPVTVRNLELVEPLNLRSGRALDPLSHPRQQPNPHGQAPPARHHPPPPLRRRSHQRPLRSRSRSPGDLVRREELRKAFNGIQDLERLLARLSLDSAGPRELAALAASLAKLPALHRALTSLHSPTLEQPHHQPRHHSPTSPPSSTNTLIADPPLTLADGGVIAHGVYPELDDLRAISRPAANPSPPSKSASAPAPA